MKVPSATRLNDVVILSQGKPPWEEDNQGIEKSTHRELRHSFVSLLSANGVPVESIAQLVGHAGTGVTEAVYRKELRPVLTDGAAVIDSIFTRNKSAG